MSLPVSIFTIVLDGMPFLPLQLSTFNRLKLDWRWIVVEGAAANTGSTAWCKVQEPRLSQDGSTKFLNSLAGHPRVTVLQRQWWEGGKDEMVQAALAQILQPCVLLQIDADELWESHQILGIHALLSGQAYNCARFDFEYYVGLNIRVGNLDAWWAKMGYAMRAWRFMPGMRFLTHEPPVLQGIKEHCAVNALTRKLGLVCEHWGLVFREQVEFKEKFYGYAGLVERWEKLQHHPGPWPASLKGWPPWQDDHYAELKWKP